MLVDLRAFVVHGSAPRTYRRTIHWPPFMRLPVVGDRLLSLGPVIVDRPIANVILDPELGRAGCLWEFNVTAEDFEPDRWPGWEPEPEPEPEPLGV